MAHYGSKKINYEKKRAGGKKTFFRKTIFKSLFFILIVSLIFAAAYASKFRIKNIEIAIKDETEYRLEQKPAEIKEMAEIYLKGKRMFFLPNGNIFLLNKNLLSAFLLQNAAYLKSANINKNFPDAIIIEIMNKQEVGVYCLYEDICAVIGEDGKITRKIQDEAEKENLLSGEKRLALFEFPENPRSAASSSLKDKGGDAEKEKADALRAIETEIRTGAKIIKKEDLDLILGFSKNAEGIGLKTEKIKLNGETTEIYFNEKWFVILDNESLAKNKQTLIMENLKIVLETQIKEKREKLKYIDLRFVNKVFYKTQSR